MVVLYAGGVGVASRTEDLSFQAQSFLIGIFLIVLVEYALLLLDFSVALSNNFVDALDCLLDAGVEIVFDMVIAASAETALLKLHAYLAPLVGILAEKSEKKLMLCLRPLCIVVQVRVQMILPTGQEREYRYRHCLFVRLTLRRPCGTLKLNSSDMAAHLRSLCLLTTSQSNWSSWIGKIVLICSRVVCRPGGHLQATSLSNITKQYGMDGVMSEQEGDYLRGCGDVLVVGMGDGEWSHYYISPMIKQHDLLVKLILIGGSGVGKSSLLMQFAENKFTDNYLTTIGVDFRFKTVKQDGKSIKFQIWDTAGQQRFRTITSAYYKGADGIIMVYDLTQASSVDDLENYWISEAYNYCEKSIKVLLLGNKCDAERAVNPDRIKKIAEKYNYTTENVSAKSGEKVYDSIKDFGIAIAKAKLQKMGVPWSTASNSPSHTPSPSSTNNNAVSPQKQQPKQQKQSKQPPKVVQEQSQPATMQLKSTSKKGGPSYQKKCC